MRPLRFGRKLTVPSTTEIKHQLLALWLKDQVAKEAAEAAANNNDTVLAAASRSDATSHGTARPMSALPPRDRF